MRPSSRKMRVVEGENGEESTDFLDLVFPFEGSVGHHVGVTHQADHDDALVAHVAIAATPEHVPERGDLPDRLDADARTRPRW